MEISSYIDLWAFSIYETSSTSCSALFVIVVGGDFSFNTYLLKSISRLLEFSILSHNAAQFSLRFHRCSKSSEKGAEKHAPDGKITANILN